MKTTHPEALRLIQIRAGAERLSFTVDADGRQDVIEGPRVEDVLGVAERARSARQSPAGADAEQRFLRGFVDSVCVPALAQMLRSTRVRTSPFLFLFVDGEREGLGDLPWEALPAVLDLPDTMVVRVASSEPEVERSETASVPRAMASPAGGSAMRGEAAPAARSAVRGAREVLVVPAVGSAASGAGEVAGVVRPAGVGTDAALAAPAASATGRILFVSSPRHAGRTLQDLAVEAGDVTREAASAGIEVRTLVEPTAAAVLDAIHEVRPRRLHLSTASLDTASSPARLRVGSGDADADWLSIPDLCSALQSEPVDVAVVTARGGLSVCGALCAAGARSAVGWSGWVDDEQMRRFSLFLHQRLLEGHTPAAAVRLYFAAVLRRGADRLSGTPVVWLRAPDLSPLRSMPPSKSSWHGGYETHRPTEEGFRGDGGPRSIGVPPAADGADVNVELQSRTALNPALLKNGRPAIDHLVVTSDVARPRVRLSITCDTGHSTSTYVRQISLLAGTQQIMTEDAHFPCLHELLVHDGTRRQVNFAVTLRDRSTDKVLAETTRALLCMGGREWLDEAESWAYLPAFVMPYARGTREIVSKAREALRMVKYGSADFMAYYESDPAEVDRQAEALFKTLQVGYGIRYMPPPGMGVYDPADRRRAGQFIRLPEDILEHRWGTCHDLSLLFAGCLEHIGIRPLVLMSRCHTFAGYWRATAAHVEYWQKRMRKTAPRAPIGREWMIHDATDIDDLLARGAITLVEATHTTKQEKSYEDAKAEHVDRSGGSPRLRCSDFDVAVDVRASRTMIQPL